MNNEAEPPATTLGAAATSTAHPDGAATAAGPSSSRAPARDNAAGRVRQRKARLIQSKIQFLGQLLRSLDVIIYYYFAYMYFLDTSFLRFLLRSSVQLNCLTPKPANFPITPQKRSVIFGIFGSAAFCVLNHALFAPPEAGEASGGYLHGGFIIDFVGQQSPVSKFRLLTTDAIILLLQLFMLSVNLERQKLRVLQSTATASTATQTAPPQDHDSEERGELRAPAPGLDDVQPSSESEGDDENGERDGTEGEASAEGSRTQSRQERRRPGHSGAGDEGVGEEENQHLLSGESQTDRRVEGSSIDDEDHGRYDALPGQMVVANINILNAIRLQWTHGTPIVGGAIGSNNSSSGASGASGASATADDGATSRLSALAQLSRRGTGL